MRAGKWHVISMTQPDSGISLGKNKKKNESATVLELLVVYRGN